MADEVRVLLQRFTCCRFPRFDLFVLVVDDGLVDPAWDEGAEHDEAEDETDQDPGAGEVFGGKPRGHRLALGPAAELLLQLRSDLIDGRSNCRLGLLDALADYVIDPELRVAPATSTAVESAGVQLEAVSPA